MYRIILVSMKAGPGYEFEISISSTGQSSIIVKKLILGFVISMRSNKNVAVPVESSLYT